MESEHELDFAGGDAGLACDVDGREALVAELECAGEEGVVDRAVFDLAFVGVGVVVGEAQGVMLIVVGCCGGGGMGCCGVGVSELLLEVGDAFVGEGEELLELDGAVLDLCDAGAGEFLDFDHEGFEGVAFGVGGGGGAALGDAVSGVVAGGVAVVPELEPASEEDDADDGDAGGAEGTAEPWAVGVGGRWLCGEDGECVGGDGHGLLRPGAWG